MPGRGGLDLPTSAVGDDHEGAAAIRIAPLLLHQTTVGDTPNVVGKSALLPTQHFGQLEQTHPSVRPIGHRDHHHVVGVREARVGVELARELTLLGFEGKTTVNRKDWGVNWNAALEAGGLLVSEKVTLEFEVSAIRSNDAS